MLAAFTYRDFRVQWFGACTSSIGTWTQLTAQNWMVLSLTGSAFYLGLDAFLQQLPIMLFTLIGGVLADRRDRRRTLLTLAVRPDGHRGDAGRCSSTSASSRSGTSCCCRSRPASRSPLAARRISRSSRRSSTRKICRTRSRSTRSSSTSRACWVRSLFGGTLAVAARWGVHRPAVDGAVLRRSTPLSFLVVIGTLMSLRVKHIPPAAVQQHAGRTAQRPHLRHGARQPRRAHRARGRDDVSRVCGADVPADLHAARVQGRREHLQPSARVFGRRLGRRRARRRVARQVQADGADRAGDAGHLRRAHRRVFACRARCG